MALKDIYSDLRSWKSPNERTFNAICSKNIYKFQTVSGMINAVFFACLWAFAGAAFIEY